MTFSSGIALPKLISFTEKSNLDFIVEIAWNPRHISSKNLEQRNLESNASARWVGLIWLGANFSTLRR